MNIVTEMVRPADMTDRHEQTVWEMIDELIPADFARLVCVCDSCGSMTFVHRDETWRHRDMAVATFHTRLVSQHCCGQVIYFQTTSVDDEVVLASAMVVADVITMIAKVNNEMDTEYWPLAWAEWDDRTGPFIYWEGAYEGWTYNEKVVEMLRPLGLFAEPVNSAILGIYKA